MYVYIYIYIYHIISYHISYIIDTHSSVSQTVAIKSSYKTPYIVQRAQTFNGDRCVGTAGGPGAGGPVAAVAAATAAVTSACLPPL